MEKTTKETGRRLTLEEWNAEGGRRFGKDQMKWCFICPSCGYVATPEDYKGAGASSNAVAFSCVGRWSGAMDKDAFATKKGHGPCNYAGGGLIGINPVTVVHPDGKEHQIFEFA